MSYHFEVDRSFSAEQIGHRKRKIPIQSPSNDHIFAIDRHPIYHYFHTERRQQLYSKVNLAKMIVAATSRKLIRNSAKLAASRGGQSQRICQQTAKSMSVRNLTLPPGSVHGYPFPDVYHQSENASHDDSSDSRSRVQLSMTPTGGRNYGTYYNLEAAECASSLSYHTDPVALQQSSYYGEDHYETTEWGTHSVAGETTDDLGSILSEDYDSQLHAGGTNFFTESSDAVLDGIEFVTEHLSNFYEGIELDGNQDSSGR